MIVIFFTLLARFVFHAISTSSLELMVRRVCKIPMSKMMFVIGILLIGIAKEYMDYVIHQPEVLNSLTLFRDGGLLGATAVIILILRSHKMKLRQSIIILFLSFVPLTVMSFFYTRFVIPGTENIWYKHVLDVLSYLAGPLLLTERLERFISA